MPINRRYGIDELLLACRDYFDKTGRRISFEYALIEGENDTISDADALAKLLKQYMGRDGERPFHVNLIPTKQSQRRQGFPEAESSFCACFRFCPKSCPRRQCYRTPQARL
jgi:23S rRNA (adenine2503-C2)-methyltransferase